MKTYRQYYWEQAIRQIKVSLTMIWYGVILDKGHHTQWKNTKKYGGRK